MKGLTVFLCSTFTDLTAEREAVLDAIGRLRLQHDSMEFFGARTQRPLETCLEEVRRSDILVVIVGHLYGSIVPGAGISFSEAEYAEGYRLKKPCLVYMRDDDVPVLPKYIEQDPEKIRLLEKWKQTLNGRHSAGRFRDTAALAVQVVADLGRTLQAFEDVEREHAPLSDRPDLADALKGLAGEALNAGIAESAILAAVREAVDALLEQRSRPPGVFLSYASADAQFARTVAEGLTRAGITMLSYENHFVAGIEKALDAADYVVFFISPQSTESEWVQQEISVAIHRRLSAERPAIIIPVLLAEAPVPALLRDMQCLDLKDRDAARGTAAILTAIRRHAGIHSAWGAG
jgi:hypothetical protein